MGQFPCLTITKAFQFRSDEITDKAGSFTLLEFNEMGPGSSRDYIWLYPCIKEYFKIIMCHLDAFFTNYAASQTMVCIILYSVLKVSNE